MWRYVSHDMTLDIHGKYCRSLVVYTDRLTRWDMPVPAIADTVFDGLCNRTQGRHTHLLIIKLWITVQHEARETQEEGEIEQRAVRHHVLGKRGNCMWIQQCNISLGKQTGALNKKPSVCGCRILSEATDRGTKIKQRWVASMNIEAQTSQSRWL